MDRRKEGRTIHPSAPARGGFPPAAGLALVCLAAAALLAAAPQTAEAVTVRCLVILGKNDDSGMDPRIPRPVQEALKRTFRKTYTGYTLHSAARLRAEWGERVKVPLPGDYTLVVRPVEARGRGRRRRILLQVEIVRGEDRIVGATVWLRPGRYWLLGGPHTDGGDLILALAVTE